MPSLRPALRTTLSLPTLLKQATDNLFLPKHSSWNLTFNEVPNTPFTMYKEDTLQKSTRALSVCRIYIRMYKSKKIPNQNEYCIILPVTALLEKHIKNTVIIEQRPGLQRQTLRVLIKNKSPKSNNNNRKKKKNKVTSEFDQPSRICQEIQALSLWYTDFLKHLKSWISARLLELYQVPGVTYKAPTRTEMWQLQPSNLFCTSKSKRRTSKDNLGIIQISYCSPIPPVSSVQHWFLYRGDNFCKVIRDM